MWDAFGDNYEKMNFLFVLIIAILLGAKLLRIIKYNGEPKSLIKLLIIGFFLYSKTEIKNTFHAINKYYIFSNKINYMLLYPLLIIAIFYNLFYQLFVNV